jgi:hypothetical protein
MTLYNTPLEPSLQLSVKTVNSPIAAVGAFNTLYFLAYTGAQSNLPSYTAELVTSLEDYANRIGGIPTDYLGLVNYLCLSAAYKNLKGLGAVKVVAVRAPSSIYTITVATSAVLGETVSYKLVINGVSIDKTILVPNTITLAQVNNYVAKAITEAIDNQLELKSSVYVRDVSGGTIELTPFVDGQPLSLVNLAGTATGISAGITTAFGPAAYNVPQSKDYLQALKLGVVEESELGVIVAPGFYATASSAEGGLFTKQADSFCRQAEYQQLFIGDVTNPNLLRVPDFASVGSYNPVTGVAINALFEFEGSIYKALTALAPITSAVNTNSIAINTRVVLPFDVKINNVTSRIVQAVSASSFVDVTNPTPAELNNFIAISYQQVINEALFALTVTVVENGSATERALYRFRDGFNSLEGHVSVVAPYQYYSGSEISLTGKFALPASVYQAALWIYVANAVGVFTPPASDDYALEGTQGPIWQVTRTGHALLNGKGINIIKTINSNAYVMGGRTLSQNDLYNRQNARLILSLYVRTLKAALKSGLVLKPLNSSGAFLEQLRIKADKVSRAFYTAGLLDGTSENEAFLNKCDFSINPINALQQGIIRLESKIAQIGMTEKIIVTVQESLIGELNNI